MIRGGYILKARKMLESDLMDKPPLWSKLWDWMLLRAEWRTGAKLERGQFITSVDEMREAMSWLVGYRRVTPTKDEIRSAYEGFTKAAMVTTMKTTRGMVFTITNYDTYQRAENYESREEARDENDAKPAVTPHDSKEVLRIKNQEQEKINTAPPDGVSELKQKHESKRFSPPSLAEVTEYLTAKGSPIDPETFHAHYEANGWVQGSGGKKIKSWKACVITWEKRYAKDHPTKPQDARWQKYRTWVARYDEKRRKWHPDAKQLTPGEIDEAAKVVAEYIAPDAYTEELLGLGIEWLLKTPERCAFVPTLKSLGDFASPSWGSLAGWATNAVRGVEVPQNPFAEFVNGAWVAPEDVNAAQ